MPTWTKAFGQYVNLIVTATESEVSVANNTSKVTVNAKLHYHTGQLTTSNWNNISYYLKIDETSYVSKPKTTSNGYTLSASSRYKDLGTYSKTITHDSNGSKSINVYVDFDDHDGWRALSNATMALTTIARASIPTVSATSIAIGSAITINTNRKSSSFRHELTFKFASRAVDTLMSTAATADKVTWTLPNDMANAIPNSTSNGGTFTLKTYNGSTLIGTNSISITVTVPSNETFNPTMGTPSYTDVGASSVTGVIDGKSKLNFTGTASPKMGATVKSIKLNFSRPGYSTSYDISRSGNTGTYSWGANTVATWSMSMTVTDSRGRSATSGSISIPVVAYSTPKLSVKASRSGTNIVLSGNATGASLSSSNTLTLETYIRTRGASSWGTVVNTATSTNGTVAPTVTTYTGYATITSYEVRVRVKDELSGWTETILPIATKKALLDIYKDVGVAIGKYYETNIGGPLQVGLGTSVFDGGINVGGTFSVAGSKNAIHATRDGFRLTPAYETAESYLGDIGESKTDYTNEVKVYIETLFHDTVNTEVSYQVFLQSYGDGFVWVSERNYDHFIVKSSAPNIAFAWELKAKRRGYEEDRLVLSETTYEDAQKMEGLHGGYSYSTQSKEEKVTTKEEGAKI